MAWKVRTRPSPSFANWSRNTCATRVACSCPRSVSAGSNQSGFFLPHLTHVLPGASSTRSPWRTIHTSTSDGVGGVAKQPSGREQGSAVLPCSVILVPWKSPSRATAWVAALCILDRDEGTNILMSRYCNGQGW